VPPDSADALDPAPGVADDDLTEVDAGAGDLDDDLDDDGDVDVDVDDHTPDDNTPTDGVAK
jgi:hypothetical protein